MKSHPSSKRAAFRILNFCILPSAFCIFLLAACSRSPQTAAELFDQMPRRYGGELHLQGETATRTLNVEVLDLKVRDAHLLEFGRIAYEVSGGDEGAHKGEAPIKGTISAPGGEIRIEDTGGAGGGDALKAGSFQGKLSGDLKTVEAKWKTGFDQTVNFQGIAER